jgi:1,4-dihydroxy-2-naphthoyl-CoA hydrolase
VTVSGEPRDEVDGVPGDVVEWINKAGEGTLAGRMGITFLEASPRRVVATMPVEGNTQLFRMLHGGASAALAESLGSIGAALHAGEDRIAVGVDINATHHRSTRHGVVTGVATPVFLGRSTATYEVVISDEEGRRLCTSRITCAIQSRRRRGGARTPVEVEQGRGKNRSVLDGFTA